MGKGVEEAAGYAKLYKAPFNSPAGKALRAMDRAVLMQIMLRYDGKNNGKIAIGKDELKSELSAGDGVRKSIKVLIELGFLRRNKDAKWSSKLSYSRACEYAITFYPDNATGLPATNEWRFKSELIVQRIMDEMMQKSDGAAVKPSSGYFDDDIDDLVPF